MNAEFYGGPRDGELMALPYFGHPPAVFEHVTARFTGDGMERTHEGEYRFANYPDPRPEKQCNWRYEWRPA